MRSAERRWSNEGPSLPIDYLSRDDFIASETAALDREFSNLVEDERGERRLYLELVSLLYGAGGGPRAIYAPALHCFHADLSKPIEATQQHGGYEPPTAVQLASTAWAGAYRALLERNPRLELAHRLKAIGFSHAKLWWPIGLESAIQEWVDRDVTAPPPFDDHHQIATPAFRQRLRDLRSLVGGCVYCDLLAERIAPIISFRTPQRVIYLPDQQWQEVRDKVAALGASTLALGVQVFQAQRRAFDESQRIKKIEHEVRADAVVWSALLQWESTEGKAAPMDVQATANKMPAMDGKSLREFALKQNEPAAVEERKRHMVELAARRDAIAPASFEPFLCRFWRRTEPPSRWSIYILLRTLARRELGLELFPSRPQRTSTPQ